MLKTAFTAVPDGEQKAPEGRSNRDTYNPDEAPSRDDARSLRGYFARSICRANDLANTTEREACADGVPCAKLCECMRQADATLRYLEQRKALHRTK